MKNLVKTVASVLLVISIGACSDQATEEAAVAAPAESAEEFVARANAELTELNREGGAASWVRSTYITGDTAIIAAASAERYAKWHSGMVQQALAYAGQELAPETQRAIDLLKLGTSLPTPNDAAKRKELTLIATELKGMYGAGQFCRNDSDCISGSELEGLMQTTRDYDELAEYWIGWRSIAPPMREKYQRYVELANEGAAELGYGDLGEMWRAGYDMSPAEFEGEAARLWEQVKPLYSELHCAVRAKLGEHYGEDKVPQDGLIPRRSGALFTTLWSHTPAFPTLTSTAH